MENGVEALKIASAVLIFVLAITITISAFTTATQALNRIFRMQNDDEYVTRIDENGEEYYLNFVRFDKGTREVGIDTIIPSIYRAYKENFSIYFYDSSDAPLELYKTENGEVVNYIDLEKEAHASAEAAINHIYELLYAEDNGLYQKIKNKTFTEQLGEYYIQDVLGETGTAEVNKIKKRVIVYTEQKN